MTSETYKSTKDFKTVKHHTRVRRTRAKLGRPPIICRELILEKRSTNYGTRIWIACTTHRVRFTRRQDHHGRDIPNESNIPF